MATTKTQVEPQTKAAPTPTTAKQPDLPDKRVGPARSPIQRTAASTPPDDAASKVGDMAMGGPSRARMMSGMQCSVGNARVSRMLDTPFPRIQRKCACGGEAGPDGECEACKAKRMGVQRQATGPAELSSIPDSVTTAIQSSGGQPLDKGTRRRMEDAFGGADFRNVRVHTGSGSARAARDIQAKAFTTGQDIHFGEGQYQPGTQSGDKLLAHELTHAVQQRDANQTAYLQIDHSDSRAEAEAELASRIFASGDKPPALGAFNTQTMQRAPEDKKPAYAAASPRILEEMNRMSDEVAKLRAAVPPAKNAAQEAQRTFAIIKVLDENGQVKQIATGEFLGKGPHAEEQAIAKLQLKDIGSTDTVLIVTDQWPCEDKCTPALQELRQQTKGEFRVFSKAGLNTAGDKVVRTPKTEATRPGSNPGLVELEEFHRQPTTRPVGPSGGPGVKPTAHGSELGGASKGPQEPTIKTPIAESAAKVEPARGRATVPPTTTEPTGEPSTRPRVTIEGDAVHPRVKTGGWKWAGRIGTGATVALSIYGAISTIDEAIAKIEKAQTGNVRPEVAKAMAAIDRDFPKAQDMWTDKFRSWHEDQNYPTVRDWLINNGLNALLQKGKELEVMGDHLNTLYWYNSGLEDLEYDFGRQRNAIGPIHQDIQVRSRVLFDVSEDILKQIPKWPNDTAQLTLWGIYSTFHDAAGDMSRLESQISMCLWEYDQMRKKAHDGRIESARWLNYYAGAYAKVANKNVIRTKFSEE